MGYLKLLKKISKVFPSYNEGNEFCLKPKQLMCISEVESGNDVIAVLPTGFGKSLIYHLLPQVLSSSSGSESVSESSTKIVLVVAPLSAIISEQICDLKRKGIEADALLLHQVNDDDVAEVSCSWGDLMTDVANDKKTSRMQVYKRAIKMLVHLFPFNR